MNCWGCSDTQRPDCSALCRLAVCFIVCVSMAFNAGAGLAKEKSSSSTSKSAQPAVGSKDLTEEQFLSEIKKYLGIPYRYGGSNRKGTDCSGLIKQIYRNLFGLNLPHNAAAQSRSPHLEEVSKDELKVGDLIFFGPNKGRINHMGAYLGDGEFIHASRKFGETTVSRLDKPYWRKRFVCSGHIKGLELKEPEWGDGFDTLVAEESEKKAEKEDAAGSQAIEWSLFALDGKTEVGLLNEVTLAPLFNLTVETFALWSGSESLESTLFNTDTDHENCKGLSDLHFHQGVRLSKELALSGWVQVAPFWSYVRRGDDGVSQIKGEQTLGLSAEIGHPTLPWSISLAAQPFLDKGQTAHSSLWERDWRQLELFFGCRYHISDSWKFSLFGSGNTGTPQDALPDASAGRAGSPVVEDVTVLIDFTF